MQVATAPQSVRTRSSTQCSEPGPAVRHQRPHLHADTLCAFFYKRPHQNPLLFQIKSCIFNTWAAEHGLEVSCCFGGRGEGGGEELGATCSSPASRVWNVLLRQGQARPGTGENHPGVGPPLLGAGWPAAACFTWSEAFVFHLPTGAKQKETETE